MNREDTIQCLRKIQTDIRGRLAISEAINVLEESKEPPYCPWCDHANESHDVHVGIWAKDYFGAETFERHDIEFDYCPMCGRKVAW